MIQSGKFDSFKMDIKKLANSVLDFTIKRLIEITGIIILILGILLFIGLISYSPTDPNFIFPENTEINNLLGYDGSVVSAAEIFRAITDWRVVVAKVRRGKSVWRRGEDVG